MTIRLAPRIEAFPVRHGKAVFAMQLRDLLWRERFDALAFAFPASLQDDALEGVDHLPAIRALVVRVDGAVRAYMPFDPCDAYIEGLRQARQRRLPVRFLEDDALLEGPNLHHLPDPYLAKGLGLEGYYKIARKMLASGSGQGVTEGVEGDSQAGTGDGDAAVRHGDPRLPGRARQVFRGLRRLERGLPGKRILFLCDFPLLAVLEDWFAEGSIQGMMAEAEASAEDAQGSRQSVRSSVQIRSYPVKPGQLYFALGEPPFFAGEMERERGPT